jgi:cyclopropane-fatty-acyl-phospholipid synthase
MSSSLESVLPPRSSSLFRRSALSALSRLEHGTLELYEAGRAQRLGVERPDGLVARMVVSSPAFYRKLALGGTLGAAESYMDGDFTTDDLTTLVRLALRNQELVETLESGAARLGATVARAWSALRSNTKSGSRKNIASHYDLGNDFFERMLDPTLSYSSGVYPSESATLEQASLHKLTLLCEKLELRPGDRLLEIGTGFGALAMHAAEHYGATVVTTTISKEQHRLASERVRRAGLADRVSVLSQDYRELGGAFDKVVSVEMIEAIGADQYPLFFERVGSLLVPGGRLVLQSITITGPAYEQHLRQIDFIKRYVFPGSSIPSVSALVTNAARSGGLELRHAEDFGRDYARTLSAWRENVEKHRAWVVARYGERFHRLWSFYLSYCEAGFSEGYLGVAQAAFEKAAWRKS